MKDDDTYNAEETARRRDDAIRRALNTPPKPLESYVGRGGRPTRRKGRTKAKTGQKARG